MTSRLLGSTSGRASLVKEITMGWFDSPCRTALSRLSFPLSALVAAAIIVLPASPGGGVAQDVGDRVRVVLVGETLIGRVSGVQDNGFHVTLPNGVSRSILRTEVRWLERDLATGTNAIPWGKKGFVRGALGGAALGFLLGLAVGPECLDSECNFAVSEHVRAGAQYGLGYAGIGGVLGGATGLILGARTQRDEWQVIPLSDGSGVLLGMRLRF